VYTGVADTSLRSVTHVRHPFRYCRRRPAGRRSANDPFFSTAAPSNRL